VLSESRRSTGPIELGPPDALGRARRPVFRVTLSAAAACAAALAGVARLVRHLAFADLRTLGAPLSWLVGSVLRVRRAHVEAAMRRAGLADPAGTASRMYGSLGALVSELLWLAAAGPEDVATVATLDPSSTELLDEALRAGRGAVLAASHTGNWELAAMAMARRARLSVLVKPVSLGVLDRFMKDMRKRLGVGLLEGSGALLDARGELRRGGVVALLLDQVPPTAEHAEWLPFLGADALTHRAAAALAASVGAPLLVTASRRGEDGRQVLHVLSVKWPTEGGAGWARRATREATEELDAFVRQYPDQWLWMHRRWRGPLGGA
jgi:KDO2-lipid IV(A) lauroyltransferase